MTELVNSSFYSTSNLKAYWQFQGNSLDTTVNNHDGTDTGVGYGTSAGKFNQGASFNGTSSVITVVKHADFNPDTSNFSVGGWVKTSTTGGMIFQSYNQAAVTAYTYGFYVYISSDKLYVSVAQGTDTALGALASATSITTGVWVHWALTRSSNTWTVYIDGVADGTTTITGNPVYHANGYVRIGAQTTDLSSTGNYFTGSMDDLFLCNGTALTATQVKELGGGSTGDFLALL